MGSYGIMFHAMNYLSGRGSNSIADNKHSSTVFFVFVWGHKDTHVFLEDRTASSSLMRKAMVGIAHLGVMQ